LHGDDDVARHGQKFKDGAVVHTSDDATPAAHLVRRAALAEGVHAMARLDAARGGADDG